MVMILSRFGGLFVFLPGLLACVLEGKWQARRRGAVAWFNDSHTRGSPFVTPPSIVAAMVYALFFFYLLRRWIGADCWMDARAL